MAAVIVSNNGSELTSAAVLRWSTGRFDGHYNRTRQTRPERLSTPVES